MTINELWCYKPTTRERITFRKLARYRQFMMESTMLFRFSLAAFLAMAAISLEAKADITMTIDTSAQTFAFSGSDTGTPQDDGSSESIIWEYLHNSIPGSPVADTNFAGFSPDLHWNAGNHIEVMNDPDFETRLSISLSSNTGPFGLITITPNTTPYDYGSFSSEQVTILTDLLVDGSIPIGFFTSGASGFSPITVTSASAVPEPSSIAIVLSIAMIGVTYRRRSVR